MPQKSLWCNQQRVADVDVADTMWKRMRGLLGKASYDHVMYFPHTNNVHTFLMRFSIDVLQCNIHGVVVAKETMPPNQMSQKVTDSVAVFEATAGTFAAINLGDTLEVRER